MFLVYIIESLKDQSYYVGHTQDIKDRLKRHNEGRSKSTKNKTPWKLVYTEEYETKSEATKRECRIKKMKSRKYIDELINQNK